MFDFVLILFVAQRAIHHLGWLDGLAVGVALWIVWPGFVLHNKMVDTHVNLTKALVGHLQIIAKKLGGPSKTDTSVN
jgi:hypothetical protein